MCMGEELDKKKKAHPVIEQICGGGGVGRRGTSPFLNNSKIGEPALCAFCLLITSLLV